MKTKWQKNSDFAVEVISQTMSPYNHLCQLLRTAGLQGRKEGQGGAETPACRDTSKSSKIYKVNAASDVLPPLFAFSLSP